MPVITSGEFGEGAIIAVLAEGGAKFVFILILAPLFYLYPSQLCPWVES